MSEIPFEIMAMARETVRGTLVTPPTRHMNVDGVLTPMQQIYKAPARTGSLAKNNRSEFVRKWGEFDGNGDLDTRTLPWWFNMTAKGGVTAPSVPTGPPTTPATGTAVLTAQALTSITLGVGGSGYTGAPTVIIFGGGGSGATATATYSAGSITGFVVTNGGSGYTSVPQVIVIGGGPAGVLAKLWPFPRAMASDNLQSSTIYFGDPNQKVYQGAYGMLDTLGVKNTPSGTVGATVSVKGHTRFPAQLGSPPALPAGLYGPIIVPSLVQVFLDTTSYIGTTQLAGRVLDVEHTFPSGVTYKYPGQGPTSTITYDHTGRNSTAATTKLTLEMVDQAQYTIWEAGTKVSLRVMHYGPIIETISGAIFRHYLQVDMYGKLDAPKWGANENSNRTVDFTIESEEDTLSGLDWAAYIQNDQATL